MSRAVRIGLLLSGLCVGLAACDAAPGVSGGTAEVVWTASKADPYDNAVQPAIDGDLAFVATDGRLTAYDLRSGSVRWSRQVLRSGYKYSSRRVIADSGGPVYVHSVDAVWAYARADGRLLWSTVVAGMEAVGLCKVADDAGSLYLCGRRGVQQVRKADGSVGRRFEVDAFAPSGVQELVYDVGVADGVAYVPTAWTVDTDSIPTKGAVYAFDTETGRRLWAQRVPAFKKKIEGLRDSTWASGAASGAVPSGALVAVTTDEGVLALDRATGALVWERRLIDRAGFWVGPTVANGAVYAAGVTRWVHKLDLATGATRWTRQVEGSLTPILTVDRGQVLFTDDGWGDLWVLDEATGQTVWHGRPPGPRETRALFLSPVAVGRDRLVVVGDQAVYGLSRP